MEVYMLMETLNDFLKETRGRRGYLTDVILNFNHRIGKEILIASSNHTLSEYLGNKVPQEKAKESRVWKKSFWCEKKIAPGFLLYLIIQ